MSWAEVGRWPGGGLVMRAERNGRELRPSIGEGDGDPKVQKPYALRLRNMRLSISKFEKKNGTVAGN